MAENGSVPVFFNESCSYLHKLTSDPATVCNFVKNASSCSFGSGYINYYSFLYCTFSGSVVYFGVVLELLWCMALFLILAIVADEFFGPSLVVIARVLRFSDNLAGVTLLALGNGAGDVFTSIASAKTLGAGDAGLMYGSLFGAGILVTTVTVGCVGLVKPFTAQRRPLLKDIIFYIIAVVWNLTILVKGFIHFAEAVGLLVLYAVYVGVTVLSRSVRLRMLKKEKEEQNKPVIPEDDENTANIKWSAKNNAFNGKRSKGDIEMVGIKRTGGFDNETFTIEPEPKSASKEQPPVVVNNLAPPASDSPRPTRAYSNSRQRSETVTSLRPSYLTKWVISHRGDDDALLVSELSKHQPYMQRQRSQSHLGHGETKDTTKEADVHYNSRRRASTIDVVVQEGAIDLNFGRSIRQIPPITEERPSVVSLDDIRQFASINRPRTVSWGSEEVIAVVDANFNQSADAEKEEEAEEYIVPGFFKHFLIMVNPINMDEWENMSKLSKGFEVFRSPLQLLLNLIIPRANDDHPTRGWCKLLIMIQCLITPIAWLVGVYALPAQVRGMPVWAIVLIVGAALATLIFFTSSYEKPPIYHWLIAMVGFSTSIVIIYCTINEVVNILETFGMVLRISKAIIALTFLAWANSIADIMSNTILAKNNFPRIAISACFAGPVFNVLLGIGIPLATLTSQNNNYRIDLQITSVQIILVIFSLLVQISHLIMLPIFKFQINRKYSYYFVLVYIVFVVIAILAEVKIIVIPISH